MNYDICAVLDGTNEIRSCKSVIYHKRDLVRMCDLGKSLDIYHIGIGIAQRLNIDRLCVVLNSCFKCAVLLRVNKCCLDSVIGKRMLKQIICTAVNRF